MSSKLINVSMISLGCPKNQVDAEMLLAKLKEDGFQLAPDVSKSDVVVINTCGFIQSAKEEAIENILEMVQLKKEGIIKAIIVTGCMAERYKSEIVSEIPEVDAVLGLGSNYKISETIKKAIEGHKTVSFGNKENLPLSGKRILTTLPYYAYIKIAEGCDNCCSYCAIPSIRGRFRSRPMEDILKEAKWLADQGVKELIVVAQDTTRYGFDIYGSYKLADLLKKLCKIEGFRWIRTLYCYPDKITDKLIDVVSSEEKLVKYFDIPIQHCNAEILHSMNRKMDGKKLTVLLEKIRKKIPDVTLRTTLITGFPGETEQQFLELCDFVDQMKFDRLGCFIYSPEEGTPAAKMPDQIDEETKIHREEIIMNAQSVIMDRLNQKKIGKVLEVVVEGYDKYGECYFGRSRADAPEIDGKIFFMSCKSLVMGIFVQVKINDILDYDLVGEVIA